MANGKIIQIELKNVRASYFYGYEPYVGTNDKGEATKTYTCHGILTPNHPQLAEFKAAQREAARIAYGDEWEAVMKQLAAQDKLCLHNGDVSKPGKDGYAGNFYVSANSKTPPTIVATRNGVAALTKAGQPDAIYSGCKINLIVQIYGQKPSGQKNFGKRINAAFMGAMFVEHGAAFGGSRPAGLSEFSINAADADAAAPSGSAEEGSDLI